MIESPTTRDRILRATAELLAEGGRDAVSTRAISSAAGVQAPTIYRTFGDLRGLLDSVAAAGFGAAQAEFERVDPPVDPVDALRAAWDHHVAFGLAEPHLYALMFTARPGRSRRRPATPAASSSLTSTPSPRPAASPSTSSARRACCSPPPSAAP
ncbi:helix-turn-helix domain-containing protein [Rathayibacter oskolensis]|uniref:TetR/AcrR family transcriptional regulator n=1 Tax=Rathayibacter oskolensis TaxID=1891671 RepID=UPI00265FA9C5|nr:TetR/AcrR family transcriptional regulator [Rathayibacter oskolensis]WKK70788.1 helix-turn-helix domain-containing protein [Rathayibacter oskolensis]